MALSIWKLSGTNIHSTVYLVPGWGKVYNKIKQRTATKWQELFNYPHFIGEEIKRREMLNKLPMLNFVVSSQSEI